MANTSGYSIVIRQQVPSDKVAEYEQQLATLHEELRSRAGFSSVEVIHHRSETSTRFVVVAIFDDEQAARAWLASDELPALRANLDRIAGTGRAIEQFTGREIWFDEPGEPRRAPYWKRVALSIVAVLPSLWLIEWLIGLSGTGLPPLGRQVVAVCALCAALTWPIMPFAERLTARWLHAS